MDKQKVLIVEDCPVMRLVIKRTLLMSGIPIARIFEANHGKEGLETLQEHSIDFIIADINMPVMDGLEMLEEIRLNDKTSAIPVLTVSTESNRKRIGFIEVLSTGFVHKPFTPEKLRDMIMKMLGPQWSGRPPVGINGST